MKQTQYEYVIENNFQYEISKLDICCAPSIIPSKILHDLY